METGIGNEIENAKGIVKGSVSENDHRTGTGIERRIILERVTAVSRHHPRLDHQELRRNEEIGIAVDPWKTSRLIGLLARAPILGIHHRVGITLLLAESLGMDILLLVLTRLAIVITLCARTMAFPTDRQCGVALPRSLTVVTALRPDTGIHRLAEGFTIVLIRDMMLTVQAQAMLENGATRMWS